MLRLSFSAFDPSGHQLGRNPAVQRSPAVSYGVLSFWSGWRPHGNATGVVSVNAESDQPKEGVMKVLMVLTSHDQLGNTGRKTGFWLEEMAAPYYVFKDV